MKTNYETSEDQESLYKILSLADMATQRLFDLPVDEIPELAGYRMHLIKLRQKIYEFMEEEDPNTQAIKSMYLGKE